MKSRWLIATCLTLNSPLPAQTDTLQVGALVFASDWAGVSGNSDAALRSARPRPWNVVIGGTWATLALAIVPCRQLGFPTENCLRVNGIIGRPPNAVQELATGEVSLLPGSGVWSIPNPDEGIYYRLYKRFAYPHSTTCEPPPTSNNNHSIEERSGSATNWSWIFASSAAGWNPVFQVWTGRSNVHRFALRDRAGAYVYLERDVVYRLEWSHRRTGANSRVHEVRIYDAAGELLHETPEFRKERWEGWASLAGFSAPYNGLESSDGLQLGTNGMGWNAPCDLRPTRDIIPMWYYAGVAVSRTGWVGPYREGERD